MKPRPMNEILDELEYLRREAFQFSLEVNPHSVFHEKIDEYLRDDEPDDWISPQQREEAYKTGRFVDAAVYPNGSVSFYTVRGTSIADVVRQIAMLCREDRERYAAAGGPTTISRAFDAAPLPPQEKGVAELKGEGA